jgi:hypothetical protein
MKALRQAQLEPWRIDLTVLMQHIPCSVLVFAAFVPCLPPLGIVTWLKKHRKYWLPKKIFARHQRRGS